VIWQGLDNSSHRSYLSRVVISWLDCKCIKNTLALNHHYSLTAVDVLVGIFHLCVLILLWLLCFAVVPQLVWQFM